MLTGLVLMLAHTALAQDAGGAAPPASGTGTTSIGGQDYYVIQPGDTLWDISSRFLGDPQAWPGLWSLNEYITNPHWIYPGNRIYFHLGDDINAPGVGLEDAGEKGGYVPPVVREVTEAPLCDFPPRFEDEVKGQHLQSAGVLSTAHDLQIRGEVFAAEVNGREIGEGDFVYARMDDAKDLDCGTILGIYRREEGKLKVGGANRYIYRIVGDVRVVRVDDDTVTVQLRDMVGEVERGDLVGDPTPFRMELDVTKPGGELRAKIIGRLSTEARLAGTGETVFLDRGTNDGIDVGTTLYVVEQRDGLDISYDGKEDNDIPERVVGRVVVVRADDDHASAVVVDATHDISTGMRLATNPNGRD